MYDFIYKKYIIYKMINLFRNHSSFILCGLFWLLPLWVKTKSCSTSCHRADYFFHFEGRFCRLHCIFSVPFWTCYYGGYALFTSGSTESRSIWKSRALPYLNFSTSDFVGSFSFIDDLYNAKFVKDLGTPNIFLGSYWLSAPFFSILESDTSYICIGYANLGIKPNKHTTVYFLPWGHIYQ